MYKLTVVSGPNRGSTYPVKPGQVTIGRQSGNTITLSSSKISKQHCVLSIQEDVISLQDSGSSNGTFVNGMLVKAKVLKPGDRIGVGEYVLELSKTVQNVHASAPALQGFGNTMQFPGVQTGRTSITPGVIPGVTGGMIPPQGPPKDLKGKVIWYFEHDFMNIFYELNKKYEWRSLAAFIFSAFVLSVVVISIYPLLESGHATIIKETERRALYMAKQIAEKNAYFLAAHAETKTDIGDAQSGEGVQAALLVDLENRILAPGEKMNQYLTSGPEAVAAVQASRLFRNGRETGFTTVGDDSMIVAIEPVKILNPTMGKNVTVAMAIVTIDSSLFTPDIGDIGMVYSQTLILAGVLAILIALILHRITLRPFTVLNEDMDKALKGDLSQVSHEYKLLELSSLWEIINSAIQRIPKGKESGEVFGGSGVGGGAVSVEEYVKPLKALGDVVKVGIVVFDSNQKIAQMNSVFEEISGIHADQAIGHDMSEVARDQAMGAFTSDILSRTPAGGEGILEDFEISGMPFKVYACAFGSAGAVPHCYVMVTTKEVT